MRFVSKRREARFVIKPTDRIIDEQRRVSIVRGKTAEFRNFRYHTDDPEIIEALLHHPEYGLSFVSAEPGEAVQKPAPVIFETDDSIRDNSVKMIQGAKATVDRPMEGIPSQVAVITKDEVVQLVDEKMRSLDNKLDNLILAIRSQEDAKKISKAKKEFHCPICHEEFPSGVAVGVHKKKAHSELKKE